MYKSTWLCIGLNVYAVETDENDKTRAGSLHQIDYRLLSHRMFGLDVRLMGENSNQASKKRNI